ncbi:MAG: hypothetical protein QE271_08060 [Bacteriovoracaceae bacterium]|nr:hypothetical protein [Bacteriovoracaceae bacterium]
MPYKLTVLKELKIPSGKTSVKIGSIGLEVGHGDYSICELVIKSSRTERTLNVGEIIDLDLNKTEIERKYLISAPYAYYRILIDQNINSFGLIRALSCQQFRKFYLSSNDFKALIGNYFSPSI